MSDPRDELLDRIQLELYHVRRLFSRAFEQTAADSGKAASEAVYAYAAGQALRGVQQILEELEQLKRSRSNKTGSG